METLAKNGTLQVSQYKDAISYFSAKSSERGK